ncbi:MAG TPA: creatininase family protein [Gemmatimonadaceae bacterium]|jgi:creatinine amidohydrolase|nr:creatininase family protein [Gemmatimonadaceae bacterium]
MIDRILAAPLLFAALLFAPLRLVAQRSVYIEDLTWPEVQAAIASGRTSAIIYTGSTEQNGPHMAIGKHNFIARWVAGAIAIKLGNALVYPTLPFAPTGDAVRKTAHMRFPGSVSLTAQTYGAVVHDVALSAVDAGFRNVFIMGDHGDGQDVLGSVAKSLDNEWKSRGARVFYVPDVYFKEKGQAKSYEAANGLPTHDVHAGTDDTSELMAIDAQHRWIRSDRLAPSEGAQTARTGVDGDPTKASAATGDKFLQYKIDDAVNQIRSLISAGG